MKLAILLATYNSEKYLKTQIDSILAQSFSNFVLYIRDDGSTDQTLLIIDEYLRLFSNIIFLTDDQQGRLSMGSFMWMLEVVDADYYMFSDHDDYWLENKVQLTLEKMLEVDNYEFPKPIIIHTDLKVVDTNLKEIASSFWNYSKINPSLLLNFNFLAVYNLLTGCTMMINKKARNISLPHSKFALMHDSWIGLKVMDKGGIIDFIPNQTILYRQHGNNAIGAKEVGTKNYFINKILSLNKILEINSKRLKMVNQIRTFNIFTYMFYKFLYVLKR
ncbi:MAG: glycosyltransferase family 2 protein [Flavobacterium sp.]